MNPLDPALYTDPAVLTAGGYLLADTMTRLMLRYEYEMPRFLSGGVSVAAVMLGSTIVRGGHAVGLTSFHQLSGPSGSALCLTGLGIAVVG